jgi:hypothetical protein
MYTMVKMLLMEQRDLIHMAVMNRYECSQQLALGISKGLA